MTKGTPVSWQIEGAPYRGSGITVGNEDNSQIAVAVDTFGLIHEDTGKNDMGYHPMIWCNTTWLTDMTAKPSVPTATPTLKPNEGEI